MNELKYITLDNVNEDILNIRKEVFVDEQKVPSEIEFELNETDKTHCCLYLNNKLIAYGRIVCPYKILSDRCASVRVGRVCVRKEYRKNGYGKLIMDYIESIVKELGFKEIEIHSQYHAKDFYKTLNYKEQGEVFYEASIAHIEMRKVIAPKF